MFSLIFLVALVLGVGLPATSLEITSPDASMTMWNFNEPMPVVWTYDPAVDHPFITLKLEYTVNPGDGLEPGNYTFPGVAGTPPFNINWASQHFFKPGWKVRINIYDPNTDTWVSRSGEGLIVLVDSNATLSVAPSGTTTTTIVTSFTGTVSEVISTVPASSTFAALPFPTSLKSALSEWVKTQTSHNTSTWPVDMIPSSIVDELTAAGASSTQVATATATVSSTGTPLPPGMTVATTVTSNLPSVVTPLGPVPPASISDPPESGSASVTAEPSPATRDPQSFPGEPQPSSTEDPTAASAPEDSATATAVDSAPSSEIASPLPSSEADTTTTSFTFVGAPTGSTTQQTATTAAASDQPSDSSAASIVQDLIEGLSITAGIIWLICIFC